jgi:oxysterol-binding protein-related protein 8
MPGQDLTRVTIPPFFLEPRSLLERMADMFMHPDLLLGVAALPDPVARIEGVLRWYLSGWHYKTVGTKKPFNPVVGETFACFWKHADGTRTQYFAEQVLHR